MKSKILKGLGLAGGLGGGYAAGDYFGSNRGYQRGSQDTATRATQLIEELNHNPGFLGRLKRVFTGNPGAHLTPAQIHEFISGGSDAQSKEASVNTPQVKQWLTDTHALLLEQCHVKEASELDADEQRVFARAAALLVAERLEENRN